MPAVPTPDGAQVAAYDFGGKGPQLLFAHATGFHAHVWLPIIDHLRDRFRCYAFDGRGHGDTAVPPGWDFGWHGFALDVLAVVEGMALDRPFAVGHSAGGTALLLAEQHRPGTFEAMYCYEPVLFPPEFPPLPVPDHPLSVGARRRREVFASRDDARAAFSSKPPLAQLSPPALRAYVEHGFVDLDDGSVRLKCRGPDEARMYEMAAVHDGFSRLGEVACPVMLGCGERTDAFGPAAVDSLAGRLPRGRWEVLAGLGHFGPMEDPAAVAGAVVRSFAERTDDPGGPAAPARG